MYLCWLSVYATYTYTSSTRTVLVNSSATREHNRFRRNLVILSVNIRGFHRVNVKPEIFPQASTIIGIPVDRCRYRFLILTISGRTGTINTIEPHEPLIVGISENLGFGNGLRAILYSIM